MKSEEDNPLSMYLAREYKESNFHRLDISELSIEERTNQFVERVQGDILKIYVRNQEYGSGYTVNSYRTLRGDEARLLSQDQSIDTNSSTFKNMLPEMALVELGEQADHIYDTRRISGMTVEDVKNYGAKCSPGPVEKLIIQYAVDHFDQIEKLAGANSSGLTGANISDGIMKFGNLEDERSELEQIEKIAPFLGYLNDPQNFNAIHVNKDFDGISKSELETFIAKTSNDPHAYNDQAKIALNNFETIIDFDPTDGARNPWTLWFSKDNAPGITSEDVSAGLAKLKHIQDEMNNLMK